SSEPRLVFLLDTLLAEIGSSLLDPLNALDAGDKSRHKLLGRVVHLEVVPLLGPDKDIERLGEDEPHHGEEEANVGTGEAEDLQGIFAAVGVEVGIREGGDDGKDRRRDAAEDRAPNYGDTPV